MGFSSGTHARLGKLGHERSTGPIGPRAEVLCGRDAIQISPSRPTRINFSALAERLRRAGEVKFNEYLLRFKTGNFELTVFQDARSIIRGTDEIAIARSLYAKYIGT